MSDEVKHWATFEDWLASDIVTVSSITEYARLAFNAGRATSGAASDEVVGFAPDTSQEWSKLDGVTAFHLIERHADDWAETGRMMESWLRARMDAAAPAEQSAPPVPRMGTSCSHCAGTGQLPGSSYLNCGHCDVAERRVKLETWAIERGMGYIVPDDLFAIYRHAQLSEPTGGT